MKTNVRSSALLLFAVLCTSNLVAQVDPGDGDTWFPTDPNAPETVASDPCIPQATSWVLGGNNIIPLPPPPPPSGDEVTAPAVNHTDIGTCNDFPFILKAKNLHTVWITQQSRVGIGTSSPNSRLTIDTRWSGGDGLNVITNNTGYAFAVHNSGGGIHAIWNDGRVAVGNTSSPDLAKLNVNVDNSNPLMDNAIDVYNISNGQTEFRVKNTGHVYAREINVQMTGFPDYVFAKEYRLMNLDELGRFINNNGHLPNVPSAEKVKVDGANIGELAKIQIEKIEELTLYILQLHKEIEELKKENAATRK